MLVEQLAQGDGLIPGGAGGLVWHVAPSLQPALLLLPPAQLTLVCNVSQPSQAAKPNTQIGCCSHTPANWTISLSEMSRPVCGLAMPVWVRAVESLTAELLDQPQRMEPFTQATKNHLPHATVLHQQVAP